MGKLIVKTMDEIETIIADAFETNRVNDIQHVKQRVAAALRQVVPNYWHAIDPPSNKQFGCSEDEFAFFTEHLNCLVGEYQATDVSGLVQLA